MAEQVGLSFKVGGDSKEAQDALRQVALAAAELAKAIKAMAGPAQLAEQALSRTASAATGAGTALEKTAADAAKADAALDKAGQAAAVASYSLTEFALEAGKLAAQVTRVLPPLGEFVLDCYSAGDAAGRTKLSWSELGEVASNLSGNLAQVGGMLQGVGASLLAWSGGALAAAGVSVKAATDMDSLTRSLIAITGNAAEAETQLARLKELAKQPGLGFEEAVQGSIQLQTARMSAQEAERTLRAVAIGVARGGGGREDLKAVILNLQQIRSAGKLTGDELKETAQRIPELRKILEERLGTSNTEALAKHFSLDQIFEAMVSGLEELQAPVDSARNSFDNLGDAAKQALAALGDTILPGVADLAAKAAAALEQFTVGWKALSPEVQGFITSSAAAAVGLTALGGLAATAAGSALLLVSGLTAGVGALVTFGPAVGAALAALTPFLPVVGGVAAAVGAMVAAATVGAVTLAIAWRENWGDIQGVTRDAVADVGAFLSDLAQQIRAEWGEIAASARETAEALRPALALIGIILNTHWTEFKAVTAATWETIKGVVESGVELVGSFIREGLAVMRGDWDSAIDAMSHRWRNLWDEMAEATQKGLQKSNDIRAAGFKENERLWHGKPREGAGREPRGRTPATDAARGGQVYGPPRPPAARLEEEARKREQERIAKARQALAAFQADLGVAAMPEGSIALRLRKTFAEINNKRSDRLAQLEKMIADAALAPAAAEAMRNVGRRSINAEAEEARRRAEAEAAKDRKQAAETAAKKPADASRRLLTDAEKVVEASANKLSTRLVDERRLSREDIAAQVAEERAGGLLLALERFGDQLRPQEFGELQKKLADALQAFDQAITAQSEAAFQRQRTQAEKELAEARDGNAGYEQLIALTEQFVRLLQARENELRERDPLAADRVALERMQKEAEARELRFKRDSGNAKAEDQTSEFRRRQADVDRRDQELTAAEQAAGPVRETYLDPKERRKLDDLRDQIAAKQTEISRLSLGSTPAELLARVKAEEELLALREQVLEVTERTAEAERKTGQAADRQADQVREREAREAKSAEDKERRAREAAARDVERIAEAAERNEEAERDLERRQRERAAGKSEAGRRTFLTDERARLLAEIADAEGRLGRLDPLGPADAEAYEQQRGRLTELRKELLALDGELDQLRPRWAQFWRDLGQSVTDSLRSAFSNAFTGLFEGLMGAKGRLNNILGDLLSDVRLTVARALSGTLQEGIESLVRGGIRSIFNGAPSHGGGGRGGSSEYESPDTERLETAAAPDEKQGTGKLSLGELAAAAGLAAGGLITLVSAVNKGKDGLGNAVPMMVAALTQLVLAFMVAKAQIAAGPAGMIAGAVVGLASLFGGKHADGGRPQVGKLNLVGERGPELFVPDVAGEIIPNHKLGRLGLNLPMADVSVAHPRLPAGRLVGGNTTNNNQSATRNDNRAVNVTINDHSTIYGEASQRDKRRREQEEYDAAWKSLATG